MSLRRALGTIGLSISACQAVAGYETFSRGSAAGHPCDALPREKVDARGLASLVLTKTMDGCFWVDRFEVTVEQYRAFLNSRGDAGIFEDRQRCAWKTQPSDPENDLEEACTRSTRGESDPFAASNPIRCVDWCDAREFCRWAGKDLCHAWSNPTVTEPFFNLDEWRAACTETNDLFPYGPTLETSRCNAGLTQAECAVLANGVCGPAPNNAFNRCVGVNGAIAMVGNVSEWVFACSPGDGGPDDICRHAGGSFEDPAETANCQYAPPIFAARKTRSRSVGFRCCAPLTPEENLTLR